MDEQNLPRTREDILAAFSDNFIEGFKEFALEVQRFSEYGNPESEDLDYDELYEFFDNKNTYLDFEYTAVFSEGGSEGEGDHVERVYEVKDLLTNTVLGYARQTGFYASYNGTDWDSTITRVYPRQVTVTQYFDKPE